MKAATIRLVWTRAGDRCEYCGLHQDHERFFRFHVEHVIARQHRGTDHLSNLALACHFCNAHKGTNLSAIDPRSGAIVRLFDPRRQKWERHFRTVGVRIIGRTASARATVALLRMNTRDRIELRKAILADERS